MNRLPWNKYFMALAKLAAVRSGCNSRPTGAVIVSGRRVVATGYNGSMPGEPQCTDKGPKFCLRRELGRDDSGIKKYQDCPSIHAEQNAINQIAEFGGIGLRGSVLYCTLFPCIHCLKNIKRVGITKIYYELIYQSDDEERDRYWLKKAEEYKLETEEIHFTHSEINQIKRIIMSFTSDRRL
ncbi:MAG: deaminase [Desulfobacteraceae bacterium]|jgi:dCMP deaminase